MIKFHDKNIDFENQNCGTCISCQGAVTLWCVNDEAVEENKCNMPNIIKLCRHWCPNNIDDFFIEYHWWYRVKMAWKEILGI